MNRNLCSALALIPALLLALFAQSTPARADSNGPSYVMMGTTTYLNESDVEYDFPTPITLHRTKDTFGAHEIHFTVLRYVSVCVATEQVCVAHDAHGHCTAWENRCVQWDYRTTPVEKIVELDFTGLPLVPKEKEEQYQLTITRNHPAGDGEDWVTTDFHDVSTLAPVKILHWSDFKYQIDLK